MRASDLIHVDLTVSTESFRYRTPMKFGGRVVEQVTVANVLCNGTLRGGKSPRQSHTGLGSMTMGVAWAWPSTVLDEPQRLHAVLSLLQQLADWLQREQPSGHPLEICQQLAAQKAWLAESVTERLQLPEPIPALAQLLAASPIEAALFDAQAKALGASSYQLLGPDFIATDLARYLGVDYQGLYLSQFVRPAPRSSLSLYHLVGALDPLTVEEVVRPIGDGLPEALDQWITRDGLTHLKIKLAGDDFEWDLQRVLQTDQVAVACSPQPAQLAYSLDFNERCQSAGYVLTLLDELAGRSPEALSRLQYIEQPTQRDLAQLPQHEMHEVAARLPVVIDESLIDLESLRAARDLGYSGIALKACKGHSEALLMAAVAQHEGLYLCVQDLTCVGASWLHSASLAAHLPGVSAVESNGRQYCPVANTSWRSRCPELFDVQAGEVCTASLGGPGLGYS